ncbi:MAG TPA: cupin domain-containing protein [Dehalococcoidia bacterium]|jgi:quercetin dioxygenase-like cupin family protein
MFRFLIVGGLLLALATLMNASTSAAPIGSKTSWEATLKSYQAPARYYDVLHERFELDPGQWSSKRTSQGQLIVTVIEGQFTLLLGDKTQVYAPGQTAHVPPGLIFRYGNQSNAITRLHEVIIIPAWVVGPPTVLEPATSPVRVTTPPQRSALSSIAPSPLVADVTMQGAELSPGYASPEITAKAFNILTVVSGEMTLRYADGTVQTLGANQGGALAIGKPVSISNEGSAPASYIMTWISESGAALTSSSSAIRPPSTGDGGLAAP